MRKNALEWAVFLFGTAALAGILGTLGYEALTSGPRRPLLETRALGEAEERGGRWEVRVRVRNLGDGPASGVRVEGEAGSQTAEFTLEHVAPHAEREGVLFFRDPPKGLKVLATGAETL